MTDRITADFHTLMDDSSMTVSRHMSDGIVAIDKTFGVGWAKKHPELLAAFIQASAVHLVGAVIAQQVRAGMDNIAHMLDPMDG